METSKNSNCLVILNPLIKQMLYYNGDDITKFVILRRISTKTFTFEKMNYVMLSKS